VDVLSVLLFVAVTLIIGIGIAAAWVFRRNRNRAYYDYASYDCKDAKLNEGCANCNK